MNALKYSIRACMYLIGCLSTDYRRTDARINQGVLFPAILLASSGCVGFIVGFIEGQKGLTVEEWIPSWGVSQVRQLQQID